MRFRQCIVQVGMRLSKNFFFLNCAILRLILNIFPFLIVVTSTPSQVEITIKFLKNFVKEGLNFCQTTLCEGFS